MTTTSSFRSETGLRVSVGVSLGAGVLVMSTSFVVPRPCGPPVASERDDRNQTSILVHQACRQDLVRRWTDELYLHARRYDQGDPGSRPDRRLRGLPRDGRNVGAPADVYELRQDRLLR